MEEKKEGGNTLSLKLLVDKNNKKVLFAEAGKDFVDFLFHIMTLPVGTVIRLLKANGMVGCVGNLYRSIESIGDTYMVSAAANKEALLKPVSPSCGPSSPLLLPGSSSPARKIYYKCCLSGYHHNHSCCPNVVDYPNATCPNCRNPMTQQVVFLEEQQMKKEGPTTTTTSSGGYVKEVVTYMVMDNLEVKPMSTISSITILNQFNIKDVGSLEEKVISVGMNEAVALLKTSLHSKNVLTDLFFGKVVGLTAEIKGAAPGSSMAHDITIAEAGI